MCSAALIGNGLQLICLFIGMCVLFYYKKLFNIDLTGDHPLKLIYNVLKYAWNQVGLCTVMFHLILNTLF